MLYGNWSLITVDSACESLYILFYLGPLYISTEFVELMTTSPTASITRNKIIVVVLAAILAV